MLPLTTTTVLDYLRDSGHLAAGTDARATELAWGVSNTVLRVDPVGSPSLVIKQAQPQLRTRIEWLSRCERIYREADVLRAVGDVLPAGVVPRVLFEDRTNFILGLEAIRADHVVWKAALLRGELDCHVARRLGVYLAAIHGRTWNRPDILPDPQDWSLFDELRIDPFYRWLARVHPETKPVLDDLIEEMSAHRVCLVHADFSPKNVLVHPDGVSLVDFETGHFGDPAFDVGFFLSHLLLKSVAAIDRAGDWQRLVSEFWSTYQSELALTPAGPEFDAISHRAVRHLAACCWARVDGKSPVDYLSAANQQLVRQTACTWLLSPPKSVDALQQEFFLR